MVKTRAQVAREEEEERRNVGRRRTQRQIEYQRKKLIVGTWFWTFMALLVVIFCIQQALTRKSEKKTEEDGNGKDNNAVVTVPNYDFEINFETYHHSVFVSFYKESYDQALSDVNEEFKFLLVYLHSNGSENIEALCRRIMPNQDFQDITQKNMVFWSCSVSTPGGYRTSHAFRLSENTYPFLALIVLKNTKMTVQARIDGDVMKGVETAVSRLEQGVCDNEAYLVVEGQDRMEKSMTPTLRQQQDVAYLESLGTEQEKEKKKREQLEKQQKYYEERQGKDTLRLLKIEAAREVEVKGERGAGECDFILMMIKLPNGRIIERKFVKSDSFKYLYLILFSRYNDQHHFKIAKYFPKRTPFSA